MKAATVPMRPYVGQAWKRHAQLGGTRALRYGTPSQPVCGGVMRWVFVDGPIPLAECDQCGYETGVVR